MLLDDRRFMDFRFLLRVVSADLEAFERFSCIESLTKVVRDFPSSIRSLVFALKSQ